MTIVTLSEMKAHSPLAEIQDLDASALTALEAVALDLLEAELGRRLTVDAQDVECYVPASRLAVLPLPERLDSITSVVSDTLGDITDRVETSAGGWLLAGAYPYRVTFRHGVTITGKWGLACPARVERVLMDVVEALAVRKSDLVSRRDELAPWGSVSDGSLRADRGSTIDRAATLENLLRYDAKKRLAGFYRPQMIGVV